MKRAALRNWEVLKAVSFFSFICQFGGLIWALQSARKTAASYCSPLDTVYWRSLLRAESKAVFFIQTLERQEPEQGGWLCTRLVGRCACNYKYWSSGQLSNHLFDSCICLPMLTVNGIIFERWWAAESGRAETEGATADIKGVGLGWALATPSLLSSSPLLK